MTDGTPNNSSGNEDQTQAWWRIAPMVFFALIAYFVLWLLFIGALLQYISVVSTGEKTSQLTVFNRRIRAYLIEIFDYLVYNREEMPFPFGDFPFSEHSENTTEAPKKPAPAAGAASASTTQTKTGAKPKQSAKAQSAGAARTAGTTKSASTRKRTTSGKTSGTSKTGAAKKSTAAARKTTTSKPKATSTRTAKSTAATTATPATTDSGATGDDTKSES